MKKIYVLSHDEVLDALRQHAQTTLEIHPENLERIDIYADLGEGFKLLATSGSTEVRITEKRERE